MTDTTEHRERKWMMIVHAPKKNATLHKQQKNQAHKETKRKTITEKMCTII